MFSPSYPHIFSNYSYPCNPNLCPILPYILCKRSATVILSRLLDYEPLASANKFGGKVASVASSIF